MRPARARAPDDRDVPLPAQRVHVEVRDRLRASRIRRQPRDLDHLQPQPGRQRVRHRHRLATARGARTASRTRARPRSAPTSTATGASSGAAAAARAARSRRRPTAARRRSRRRRPQRVRDFVNSRVVGGVQQIKAHIDFHTYSELVLWPYGYTTANTAPGLDRATTRQTLSTLGRSMAATNGYTPEQASRTSTSPTARSTTGPGACTRSPRYTFEMYPRSSNPGFYPPGSVIGARGRRATARPCCSCSTPPTASTR